MSSLERAIEIAAQAHAGQTDKAGAPDILHPLRVMLSVSGPFESMAAVLHDVVEDKWVSLDQLRYSGFPPDALGGASAPPRRLFGYGDNYGTLD